MSILKRLFNYKETNMIETEEILDQAEKFYKTAKYCIGEDYNNGWYVGKKELSTEEAYQFLFFKSCMIKTDDITNELNNRNVMTPALYKK